MSSQYLTASELAELVGCKPNQKKSMQDWLNNRNWKFEPDKHGFPKVARLYHDRRMGINEEKQKAKYAEVPNLAAFA